MSVMEGSPFPKNRNNDILKHRRPPSGSPRAVIMLNLSSCCVLAHARLLAAPRRSQPNPIHQLTNPTNQNQPIRYAGLVLSIFAPIRNDISTHYVCGESACCFLCSLLLLLYHGNPIPRCAPDLSVQLTVYVGSV